MEKRKIYDIKPAANYAIEQGYLEKRNWSRKEFDAYIRFLAKYIKKTNKEYEKLLAKKEKYEKTYKGLDEAQAIEQIIKSNNKKRLMELRNYFNLNTDFWCFIGCVNCYAYVLGIDLPPQCFNIKGYFPGCFYEEVNQTKLDFTNSDTLVERMEMDFETLELDYHIAEPDEEVGEDEWKIAFFNDINDTKLLFSGNFHFLRQGKDGTWYHKPGFLLNSIPTNKDKNGKIITDPREAYLNIQSIVKYEYERCYSLKMR